MQTGRPIIDMHHHFIPPAVFQRLVEQAGGQTRLVTQDISITLAPALADVQAHLTAMDHAGVTTAVLSNPGLNFLGLEVCWAINDGMAQVAREHPGRLVGCAHLPAEAGAAEELDRCVRELGLPAIALPTAMNDVNLDDALMDPIWEAAQRLRTPIILHPALLPKGAETDYGLERSIARPTDTTKAAARILCNVFERYPDLSFVLPHLGGTLALLKGRIAMFYEHPTAIRPLELQGYALTASQQRELGLDRLFEERFRRFYVDTAGTGAWPPAVKMAADVFGADRMVVGSDFPLEAKSGAEIAEVISCIYELGLSDAQVRAVEATNAEALLAAAAR